MCVSVFSCDLIVGNYCNTYFPSCTVDTRGGERGYTEREDIETDLVKVCLEGSRKTRMLVYVLKETVSRVTD